MKRIMMDKRLTTYFSGLLSDTEKLRLFKDLEADEAIMVEFVSLQNLFSLSKMVGEKGDGAYAALKFSQFRFRTKKHQMRRMTLTLSKYAAVFLLLLGSYYMIDRFVFEKNKVHYTLIEVPVGQTRQLTLADGTKVLLGSNTSITVPDKFAKDQRLVELDGEALFTVVEDKSKPFIVKTSKYNIHVLGTKFNVYAYAKSNEFETSLIHGSVCIDDGQIDSKKIYLKPSEKAEMLGGNLVKAPMNMAEVSHMNDGVYTFDKETVGEVLERLERYYDVTFQVSNASLLASSFSGEFKSKDRMEDALTVIQQSYAFKYKRISENITEIY